MNVSEQQAATDQHNQTVKKAMRVFYVVYVFLFMVIASTVSRGIVFFLSWIETWTGVRFEGVPWLVVVILTSLFGAFCLVRMLHLLVGHLAGLAYRTSPPSN